MYKGGLIIVLNHNEKGRDGGRIVNFEYTFHYDKVTAMIMRYPIVVHNQLIDERFLSTEKIL